MPDPRGILDFLICPDRPKAQSVEQCAQGHRSCWCGSGGWSWCTGPAQRAPVTNTCSANTTFCSAPQRGCNLQTWPTKAAPDKPHCMELQQSNTVPEPHQHHSYEYALIYLRKDLTWAKSAQRSEKRDPDGGCCLFCSVCPIYISLIFRQTHHF